MNRKRTAIVVPGILLLLLAGTLPVIAQNFQGMSTLQNIASEGQGAGKYAATHADMVLRAWMTAGGKDNDDRKKRSISLS